MLLPGETDTSVNIYAGEINKLPSDLHEWLMSPLPVGLLEVYEGEASNADKRKAAEFLASNVMEVRRCATRSEATKRCEYCTRLVASLLFAANTTALAIT